MEDGRQTKQPGRAAGSQRRGKRVENLSDWEADPDREVESKSAIRMIIKVIFIILVLVTLSGGSLLKASRGDMGKRVKWKRYWPLEVRVPKSRKI
jgi:hypothetical protein